MKFLKRICESYLLLIRSLINVSWCNHWTSVQKNSTIFSEKVLNPIPRPLSHTHYSSEVLIENKSPLHSSKEYQNLFTHIKQNPTRASVPLARRPLETVSWLGERRHVTDDVLWLDGRGLIIFLTVLDEPRMRKAPARAWLIGFT